MCMILTQAIEELTHGRDLILDRVQEDAPTSINKVNRKSDLFEEMIRRSTRHWHLSLRGRKRGCEGCVVGWMEDSESSS